MLRRGLGGYRLADRIADTSTSTISSIAVGEVRIAGTIEAAEVMLVSALQSVRCVYYRSTIDEDAEDVSESELFEERSVGFRVRDASGSVRVFPRGARFDAPLRFDEKSDTNGDEPAGLDLRSGSAIDVAEPDREALIAELLRRPSRRRPRPRPASAPSRSARPPPLPRGAPRAGRRSHDRRSRPPVRRAAGSARLRTSERDPTCRSPIRRSPPTSRRRAPRARSWTTRSTRGAMPPSQASGSAAR